MVFQILSESPKSLSAQEVCQRLDLQSVENVDHASVYRNLSLFGQLGLVHRFQDGSYSICHHETEGFHLHIVANCTRCGKTSEVREHTKELCKIAKQMSSYLGEFSQFSGLTLEGCCDHCQD